jgi:hypothetical protein
VRADGENPITASAKLHVARLPRDGDSNHPTGWVQRRAWLGRRRTPPRYPPLLRWRYDGAVVRTAGLRCRYLGQRDRVGVRPLRNDRVGLWQ